MIRDDIPNREQVVFQALGNYGSKISPGIPRRLTSQEDYVIGTFVESGWKAYLE